VVLVVLVAAGCTGGHHSVSNLEHPPTTAPATPQVRAVAACRAAVPRPATFFNAQAATVAELRSYHFGPNARPLLKAFPKAKPTAFAAWCWGHRKSDGYYIAYVVGPDGSRVVYGQAGGRVPAPKPGMPTVFV